MRQPQDPTTRHTAKTVLKSMAMSFLAGLTWAAATMQAAASASIVFASYVSAWIMRVQHRLLLVFTRYGGAVIQEADGTDDLTEEEIEQEQRGPDPTDAEVVEPPVPFDDDQHAGPRNLFGGRPPKGQA